ncbi:MAG: hypothetical protein UU87_C0003G0135 [Parcubacteria group bacterium GW2011_GWA2_42_11]|nr:MAG: hypothetical protein UU87_C0003G0135 [Parcubacteria group bacterium GW2011_GWA2_42_11]
MINFWLGDLAKIFGASAGLGTSFFISVSVIGSAAYLASHCLTRLLARLVLANFSQSRDGFWSLLVIISTTWPLVSGVSSETNLSSTKAPWQWWPISEWML